jgi:hypothetical protein
MKKIYLIILTLLILNGCTPIGGNCNYQKTKGTAVVKSFDAIHCIVDFYVQEEAGSAWRLRKHFENIEASCMGKVRVGEEYSATYSKAMHGSCTPYFLRVNFRKNK